MFSFFKQFERVCSGPSHFTSQVQKKQKITCVPQCISTKKRYMYNRIPFFFFLFFLPLGSRTRRTQGYMRLMVQRPNDKFKTRGDLIVVCVACHEANNPGAPRATIIFGRPPRIHASYEPCLFIIFVFNDSTTIWFGLL